VPGAKTPAPASRTQTLKPVPEVASEARPADPLHLFTVNDEKGLLLTCVAPDLDTNIDTDVFKSCTLAPGRTLDDMMHTFIRGIHYEQSQHQKEHDAWAKELEERTAQKPAVKP
jgi:hypothetical protein